MNLIIDQGNTHFKIGIFDQKELVFNDRFKYDQGEAFDAVLEKYDIARIIISSVVNQDIDLTSIKHLPCINLNHSTPIPISNAYGTPSTLGDDRIANAVAAWSINPNANSLVIDLGTCIKYDLVNAQGSYLGGNISAGLHMRYKALKHFTDQLPQLKPIEKIAQVYGTDTETSMQCGVQLGIWHEIKGFISRYNETFSQLTIFMTGGDLKYFDKTDKKSIFANPNLTLIGLNEILNYNA